MESQDLCSLVQLVLPLSLMSSYEPFPSSGLIFSSVKWGSSDLDLCAGLHVFNSRGPKARAELAEVRSVVGQGGRVGGEARGRLRRREGI